MHIGLLVLGDLIVDHVGDIVDIDTAGGDIGGNEDVDLSGAESLERLLPGDLAEVAVHGADLEAALGEFVGHLLRGALGAGEDHRRAAALGLEDAADHLHLVQRVGAVGELLGGVVGGRTLHALGPDVGGLGHERAGQGDDRIRHGGREQHRLPLGRNLTQDPLDIGQEAQIQHLVGLIEYQHRQSAELQVALLGEVEQPARGADDDIGAYAQGFDLRLVGAPAVDRDDAELASPVSAEVLGRAGQVVVDLNAQLAGGHHDQCARSSVEWAVGCGCGGDAVQQWHSEGEGLTHAGARLADEVIAGQCQREGEFLNREGVLDALLGERADDFLADAEVGEAHGRRLNGCGLFCRRLVGRIGVFCR